MTNDERFLAEVERIATDGTMLLKLLEMVRDRDAKIVSIRRVNADIIGDKHQQIMDISERNVRLRKMVEVARSAIEVCDGRKAGKMIALEALAELDRLENEK